MPENSKMSVTEKILARFGFVIPIAGVVLGISALIGLPLAKKFGLDPIYRDTKQLEGIVIKENFRDELSSGPLEGPSSYGHYYIVVESDEGKRYNFSDEGHAAIRADLKYDLGDKIKWKESFKPGYRKGIVWEFY